MNQNIIIKSFPHGLTVVLNGEAEFETLLSDIQEKFRESEKFFKDARLALSLEGRALSKEEENRIVTAICEVSGLDIVCLVGKDDKTERIFTKAVQQAGAGLQQNNGQFYRGSLKNGAILETESSIVILGDVYPGSAVISAKDIIILGGLYGEAYAGGNGEKKHFAVALDMNPEKLKVGDFRYRTEKTPFWGIKPKVQPKIAYIRNDKVVVETLTKELLVASIL